jgi:hypothetical protein
MAKAADRNAFTYAYAAHPYSNATLDVSVISLNSGVSKCESPSTTTTIGFLTRNPIGFEGSEWGLYELFDGRVLKSFDPSGLDSVECTRKSGGGPGPGGIPFKIATDCNGCGGFFGVCGLLCDACDKP